MSEATYDTVLTPSSYPAHQFQDKQQQRQTATLGMWTFLATEVLFFGVLFTSYYVYRHRWTDAFADGSRELYWWLGGTNTAVLLGSSFAMACAVNAASRGEAKKLFHRLLITIILGLAFLGIKGTEYILEYHEALVPVLNYSDVAPDQRDKPAAQQHHRPEQVKLFMTYYFVMTLFHATHMIIGIGVLCVIAYLSRRGLYTKDYHNPVEIAGLYWHFVDIVWVFLFPTLYLLRHA
jgi:cytochrome c oxidase subunit 3